MLVQQPKFGVGGFDRGMLSLSVNDAMGLELAEVLEEAMRLGMSLPPSVYAFGERILHRVRPGAWFGVEQADKRIA